MWKKKERRRLNVRSGANNAERYFSLSKEGEKEKEDNEYGAEREHFLMYQLFRHVNTASYAMYFRRG